MDGVFMFKIIKIGFLLILMIFAFESGKLWADKCRLQDTLVRMHVVANSNSPTDQQLKQKVKDAIVAYITPYMENVDSQEMALMILGEHLEDIRLVGKSVLETYGVLDEIQVILDEESFDTRDYDTFSLPAGVYQTLEVCIGEGEGKNWWCVAFPTLCVPTTTEEFTAVAASAGLDEEVTNTLTHESGYQLRFYFLDQLGKLENLFSGR